MGWKREKTIERYCFSQEHREGRDSRYEYKVSQGRKEGITEHYSRSCGDTVGRAPTTRDGWLDTQQTENLSQDQDDDDDSKIR